MRTYTSEFQRRYYAPYKTFSYSTNFGDKKKMFQLYGVSKSKKVAQHTAKRLLKKSGVHFYRVVPKGKEHQLWVW